MITDHSNCVKAAIYKVPHHGSQTADHPKVWSSMLVDNVIAVLTPWNLGDRILPTRAGVDSICSRTTNAFATMKVRERIPHHPERAVEKVMAEVPLHIHDVPISSGHIRIRASAASNSPDDCEVRLFGGALSLQEW